MDIDPQNLRAAAAARRAEDDRRRAAEQARAEQIRVERAQKDMDSYNFQLGLFRERLPSKVQSEVKEAASSGYTNANVEVGMFADSHGYRLDYAAGLKAAGEVADKLNSIPGIRAQVQDERTVTSHQTYWGATGTRLGRSYESDVNKVSIRVEFE